MGSGKGRARRAKSAQTSGRLTGANLQARAAVVARDTPRRKVSLPRRADGEKLFSYRHPGSGIESVETEWEGVSLGERPPRPDPESGTINYYGVLLQGGRKVGVWDRWINKETAADGNERLMAINSWLIIKDPDDRKTGFGRAWAEELYDRYRQLVVHRVQVRATE